MVKTLSREDAFCSSEPIILKDYDEVQLSDFSGIKAEFKKGSRIDLYECQNIPSDINFENCSVVWIDCDNFEKLQKEGKCNFGNANVYICPTANNKNNSNSSYYNTEDYLLLPEDKSANIDYLIDVDKELIRNQTSYSLVPDYGENFHISRRKKFSTTKDTVYGLLSDSEKAKVNNYAKRIVETNNKTSQAINKKTFDNKKHLAQSGQSTSNQKSKISNNISNSKDIKMPQCLIQKNDATYVKKPEIINQPNSTLIKKSRER